MNIKEKLLTPNNYSRPQRNLTDVLGFVVHWVGNPKSTAIANRNYFEGLKDSQDTYASAHYIIGLDGEIIQCLPENEMAYHVGSENYTDQALKLLSSYPNNCTIGIECCHLDWDGKMTDETYQSLIELTTYLCDKYNKNSENLWLHYDITWKDCHRWFVNNPDEWKKFKDKIDNYLKEVDDMAEQMSKYFVDITEKHDWDGNGEAVSNVDWLYEQGLISGVGNDKFAPDRSPTRYELAQVMYRIIEYIESNQ